MGINGFYFRFDESHDRKWVTHAVNISGRDGHVINALIMTLHKQLTRSVGDILSNYIILRLNKFHVHQCQAQIEIWHSPDIHLTQTLTRPLPNFD